jgi:DNA-binding MarR family transcriptional regulator
MTEPDLLPALERVAVGAVSLTTRALEGAPGAADLTFPQWRVLLILGERAAGARPTTVAARVGTTLPATTRLLRRLERRGLVAVEPDPTDRRARLARLTPSGADLRAAILERRRMGLRDVAARIAAAGAPAAVVVAALAEAFEAFA